MKGYRGKGIETALFLAIPLLVSSAAAAQSPLNVTDRTTVTSVTCTITFLENPQKPVQIADQVILKTTSGGRAIGRVSLAKHEGKRSVIFSGNCNRFIGPPIHSTDAEMKAAEKARSDKIKAAAATMRELNCDLRTQILKGKECISCPRGKRPNVFHANCIRAN